MINIVIPNKDSNLGPKCLSLLEFETWQLRPLGHHVRFIKSLFRQYKLSEHYVQFNMYLNYAEDLCIFHQTLELKLHTE